MGSNNKNSKISLFLIAIIIFGVRTVGCESKPRVITMLGDDMINNARANEEANVETIRLTQTEAFNKQFSGDLYWKKYDELEKKLNEAFNEKYKNEFGDYIYYDFFCITNNEYFNESLEKLKNGQLTISQILENPEAHLWKMSVQFIGREKRSVRNEDVSSYERTFLSRFSNFNQAYRSKNIDKMQNYIIVSNELMKSKDEVIKMSLIDNPIYYMANISDEAYIKMGDMKATYPLSNVREDTKAFLKAKYNEEFVWNGVGYNENGSVSNLYSPKRDLSLKFMTNYSVERGDKYRTVLAQRAMYEEIEKIIEEEGYGGKIAHLTTPDARYLEESKDLVTFDMESYDMSKPLSNEEIIDKVFRGTYDTSLNLMLDENEEIDYIKLKKICERIAALCPTTYQKKRDFGTRNISLIYFYRLSEEHRQIVVDLFSKEWCTENYYREESTLANMWDNMVRERAETTGFHYLDIYGTKETFYFEILNNAKDISEMSIEAFKNKIENPRIRSLN